MPGNARLFGLILAITVSVLGGLAVSAQPQTTTEDQALVDLFFRDKIVAARRSRDTADDIQLIQDILEQAESVPDSPGVQWLMYQTAIDLATSSEVYPWAIESAMRMRATFPDTPATSDQALLDLMEQAYRDADRSDRPEIAEPYLALLESTGQAAEEAGDITRAAELYRTGAAVARAVRSDLMDRFAEHVRRLSEVEQLNNRIRQLTNAVQTNPRNVTAARELVMLLVVERRDCGSALEFVDSTQDADLIDVVAMAAAGLASAEPTESLRVADWYLALAEQTPDHAAYLLTEAVRFYDRFIGDYQRDDALSSRVGAMRELAASRLDDLREAEQEAARGTWTDAIALIDPQRHAFGDAPTIRSGQVHVDDSGFIIPFNPEGAYDVRVRVRFEGGDDGITFYLPLGEEDGAVYMYSRHEHSRIQILGGRKNEEETLMLTPGREVELSIQVRPMPQQAVQILCLVDDTECARWEGEVDKLRVPDNARPSERHGNTLMVRCGGAYVFQSIELRQPED